MENIRVWLTVNENNSETIWTCEMEVDVVPNSGDSIHLPVFFGKRTRLWPVRVRYRDTSGVYHVEMVSLVVDRDHPGKGPAWLVSRDGQPELALRQGGWITLQDFKEVVGGTDH